MAFEVTRQEILKQANDLLRLFRQTRNQKYKDEENRLRRIVTELEAFTSGGGATDLNGLSDVTISAPTNAQVLTYNSTTSQWENQTPGGGGGGGDMYKSTYDVDNDGIVDGSETTQIIVRNSTGSTLTKGQVVYLSGATGNRPNAVLSQAHTEATSSKTIGIVVADISNNSDGYVAVNGTLHDLDTSAFTAGDAVWLSATTAGAYTSTIPAEPNHTVFIGYIARSHPTQGRLVILIQNGYELNELHGVLISSEANNDLLVYESSTSLWKNKTISTIFGGTPLVSVPTLAQVTTAGNTTTNAITVGLINSTALRAVVTITDTTGGVNNPSYFGSYDNFLQLAVNRNPSTGVYAQTGKASSQISLEGDVGTSSIRFYTTTTNNSVPSERLRIFGNGNITINTTTDAGYKLDVNGTARVQGALTANSFVRSGGTSSQFLKADGSVDSTTYLSSAPTLNQVTTAGNTTTNSITLTSGTIKVTPSNGTVNGDAFVAVTNATTGGGAFYIKNPTDSIYYGGFSSDSTQQLRFANYVSGKPMLFYAGGADRMTIFSTGNIGINTTTDAGHKLRVNGTVSAALTNATHANAVYYNTATGELTYGAAGGGTTPTLAQVTTAGNTTTNAITVGGLVVDTNTLVVDSVNNRVGIGTTTPSTLLEVVGNYAGVTDSLIPQLKFQNSNTTSSAHLLAIARVLVGTGYLGGFPEIWIQAYRDASNNGTTSIRTTSNHPLNFWTNDIERLRIFANGNVGIGTTTDAGYKLDVNGTFRSNGDTLVTTANGRVAGFTGLGSGQTVHLQYGGDSNHRISTLYGSGVTFDAYHGVTIRTSGASIGKALIVNQRNSAHYIQEWQDNGTTRAFIDSGGNLFLSPLNSSGDGFVTATGGILNTISYGYTGIITFPTNPPGQQNLDFQNGILVNVF